jgi:antitoxin MazE
MEVDMETRVKKWGNSLALRIPKPLAAEVGIEDNSPVELSLLDGKLIVAPVTESQYSLEGLLAQVTEENVHGEVDTGAPMGGEVW